MIDAVARRSPRTAAREQPLLAATRESNEALPAMKTKGSQIKKEKKTNCLLPSDYCSRLDF